ncbi:MAG TPA: hypothetical protein VHE81_00455 [Lacipirellulaceae bacterium]|nr:hypothetical protein [Lacipirellulaceae bacterium]
MHQDARLSVIRRFFSGLTEFAFQSRLGIADPPLVDYIAELLVRFVRSDELYAVRSVRGQRLVAVADMLAEAQHREGPARQQVHRHIGDFTLFWTGVYPEVVDRLRRGSKDALIDYQQQGKRAYWIASTIPVEKEAPAPDVLKRLSEQFDLCVYGLGEVRRQWEKSGDADAPLLLG